MSENLKLTEKSSKEGDIWATDFENWMKETLQVSEFMRIFSNGHLAT